jgi:hypothetical protein
MGKVIKLTESELTKLVERIIKESHYDRDKLYSRERIVNLLKKAFDIAELLDLDYNLTGKKVKGDYSNNAKQPLDPDRIKDIKEIVKGYYAIFIYLNDLFK